MGAIAGKPVKVVVNARFLCQPLTGVQRFAMEISLRLKTMMEGQIQFVAPSDIRHQDLAEKLGATIIGKHTGQVWEQWDLARYLKQQKNPTLLCLGGGAPVFYKNTVFTLHDIVHVRYPQSYSFAYRMFYNLLLPPVLKNAKTIVTVSEFSRKEIAAYYHQPLSKIEVVNNAVSDVFLSADATTTAEHYVLPANKYFLAVSSPAYHKNFPFLVKAFLAAPLPEEVQLCIVGTLDSNLYKSSGLDENIRNNPRINFLGRISDTELKKLYHHAVAFVFPSLYEGFGIPPLEAEACGCLVLSSDAASLPEVLGDSALYFSPTDGNSLQQKFVHALDVPAAEKERIKVLALHNLKKYSWDISAGKISQVLRGF